MEKGRREKARKSKVGEGGMGRSEITEAAKRRDAMRAERAVETGEKSRMGERNKGAGKWRGEKGVGERAEWERRGGRP